MDEGRGPGRQPTTPGLRRRLGIPLLTLDLSNEYRRAVVDYLIAEYRVGRTPNPDVMCNRAIKFGAFYDWAMSRGAPACRQAGIFVATGHYARLQREGTFALDGPRGKSKTKVPSRFRLLAAADAAKDQSYFLWTLRPEQLTHCLFPIGDYQKSEVRRLAKKFGLPVAAKKDSQGLCFLGPVNLKEFLKNYLKPKRGLVLNEVGETIGEHDGAWFHTLGERHGFKINARTPAARPLYVVAKDINKNTLTVASNVKRLTSHTLPSAPAADLSLTQTNWLAQPAAEKIYQAQVRYHGERHSVKIKTTAYRKAAVTFQGAAPLVAAGQSLVVYDGPTLLGGGVIS